jgi:hypothetical protein
VEEGAAAVEERNEKAVEEDAATVVAAAAEGPRPTAVGAAEEGSQAYAMTVMQGGGAVAAEVAALAAAAVVAKTGRKSWGLTDEEKKIIEEALTPANIPLPLRNKCYAAINRAVSGSKFDAKELVLWNADTSQQGKFSYLKRWAEDPSRGKLQVVSSATTTESQYENVQFGWFTKFDVYAAKAAYHSQEAKEYCDALLKGASKSRPHLEKQYRKDKRFTQYWLLKSAIEGSSKATDKAEGYTHKEEVEAATAEESEAAVN